jgi:hypothetical protein
MHWLAPSIVQIRVVFCLAQILCGDIRLKAAERAEWKWLDCRSFGCGEATSAILPTASIAKTFRAHSISDQERGR